MVRRSHVWVFNTRQHHIHHNFDGPDDPGVHGAENVGQPWFGKTGETEPDPHRGDLILFRRTSRGGDEPPGVVGLWRFAGARRVGSREQIPWTDKAYDWVLYCRPIQLRIDPAFTEDWESLPLSYRHIQGEVISLAPEHANAYLTALLGHDHLSDDAEAVLRKRSRGDTEGTTPADTDDGARSLSESVSRTDSLPLLSTSTKRSSTVSDPSTPEGPVKE